MTDSTKLLFLLGKMKEAIDENAQFLTDLDAAIDTCSHKSGICDTLKHVIHGKYVQILYALRVNPFEKTGIDQ